MPTAPDHHGTEEQLKRRSLSRLGETEMEVLHQVWAIGEASVADVHERMLGYRSVAYTTVMTVMKKLADKGYLQFAKDGATYVYSAARSPEEVQRSLVDDLAYHRRIGKNVTTLTGYIGS